MTSHARQASLGEPSPRSKTEPGHHTKRHDEQFSKRWSNAASCSPTEASPVSTSIRRESPFPLGCPDLRTGGASSLGPKAGNDQTHAERTKNTRCDRQRLASAAQVLPAVEVGVGVCSFGPSSERDGQRLDRECAVRSHADSAGAAAVTFPCPDARQPSRLGARPSTS